MYNQVDDLTPDWLKEAHMTGVSSGHLWISCVINLASILFFVMVRPPSWPSSSTVESLLLLILERPRGKDRS